LTLFREALIRLEVTSAGIPIHDVLKEMKQRRLLSDDEYVASIELGNEVMGGVGTTWIQRLEVELR
jgi:hypothetical protein